MPLYGSPRSVVTRLLLLATAVFLASCERITPGGFSGDVEHLLSRGEAYLSHLAAQPSDRLEDHQVLALGYAERVRLGMGSPFRTIDFALRDPDLPDEARNLVAYGLLSRTVNGRSYFVDPQILDMVRLRGVPDDRPTGYQQLRLIERAVMSAPSAVAGERTVRLGYLLAASERSIDGGQSSLIAHVAALLGDRRRAQEDATMLLRAATLQQAEPLALLREWREDLRFGVERPLLAEVSVRDEEYEAREGAPLALALRTLAQRQGAPPSTRVSESPQPVVREQASYLRRDHAERLRRLSRERNYPAQAPVAVAVAINRDGLVSRPGLPAWQREMRSRFADEAINEERLVAGAAVLSAAGAGHGQRMSLIVLQASTFMRVWNQEEPWFPGDPAPAARDLEGRFSLASIRFDDSVDEAWRPYYLRMLGRALTDVQRVLPTISVRGLAIRIGDLPADTRALALHEPRTRTLHLPPHTGAGTLAHELAHDLDWQLARRRYGARGGYATDLAVRDNRGDRIASAMMELTTSLTQPATELPVSAHSTRPAEVFARGMDWLVAAMLARDGRLGGYLTSFQDPVLTGYGTTRGPDITGSAVPALLSILDGVAPAADQTRDWALDTYGPNRNLTAMELARTVTEAGAGLPPDRRLYSIETTAARSLEAISDCRFGSAEGLRRLVTAQRSLALASLGAAARGAAIDAVHALANEQVGPHSRSAVDAWLAWRLYGAPEPVEPLIESLVPSFEDLLLRATLVERADQRPTARSAFYVGVTPALCGGNPFAADTPVGRFRTSTRSTRR
jgi:hypothetical protein